MKIVVITHNYIRRKGDLTALYLHRLSTGLVNKEIGITVICPHAPGLSKEDTIDGVRIIRFSYLFSRWKSIAYTGSMDKEVAGSFVSKIVFLFFIFAFYRQAKRLCRRELPDLIWANWWIPPGLIAARIARIINRPLVISSHGTDIALLGKKGIIGRLARYVYNRTNKATVVSHYLREKLLNHLTAFGETNVEVVPMPVGMENFIRSDVMNNEIPVFLSVARFTRQKRLDDILSAAEILRSDQLQFKIIFVGEGPLEKQLKESVNEKRLDDWVEFKPMVAQKKLGQLYRESDAVVLSSEGEGFGLVLVEAGFCGRPVIGSRSGGITDIIDDTKNGLLFELGNIDDLARCMKAIIGDGVLRTRLGDEGYKKCVERFSTTVLVDRMYNIFRSQVDK